jgi:polygalacturonase
MRQYLRNVSLSHLMLIASLIWQTPPVAGDAIDVVRDYSCRNDGGADAAAAINRAIAEAVRRTVFVPEGVYLLESSIEPVSGTRLCLSPKAEMRRGFDGGNGNTKGALIQGDKSFDTTDVRIRGGRWTNPGNKYTGRVANIIGENWTLDFLKVTSWGTASQAAICIAVFGDNITLRHCEARGSAKRLGQAGVRVLAGTNVRVADCYFESGDDTFCAFPVEVASSFGSGRPLGNVTFELCRGKSFEARFLACGLTAVNSMRKHGATLADLNNVHVSGIEFVDCEGASLCKRPFGPAFFVANANPNPGAAVANIRFVRCAGRVTEQADQCVKITAKDGAICEQITFDQCKISGGSKEAITINRGPRKVLFKDCVVNGTPYTDEQ